MAYVHYTKKGTREVLYDCSEVEDLISRYYELGGTSWEVEEGCLGYGLTICAAPGYKSAIITEVYINAWSSGHKVRFYNKMPAKYEKMIEDFENRYDEETA